MENTDEIRCELYKRKISQIVVARELGLHPNTLTKKLDGVTAFTIDEAFEIKDKFLPDINIRCFSREKPDKAS